MKDALRKPNIHCVICKYPLYRRPSELEKSEGRAFCSMRCFGIFCRKEIPCIVCGKLMLAGLNKKTCSRSCANKHREGIKYKIGRPRDKVYDIRSIKIRLFTERGKKCERCAYGKYEVLQVHHKDRNKKNNNFDNLELICPNCHYEEHHLKNSWLNK